MPRDLSAYTAEDRAADREAEHEAYHDERILRHGAATTLRNMLTEHAAEEPSTEPYRCLGAFEAAKFRKRAEARHAEWRERLDELARAYVAALDREGVQMPLQLAGVAR